MSTDDPVSGNPQPSPEENRPEPSTEGRENSAVTYERRDINAFAVTATGLGFGLGTLAVVMLMWFLFDHFLLRHESVTKTSASQAQLPPEPRLQKSPPLDLETLRRMEDRTLGSYQWVDRRHGIASIPIDEAIDQVARHGLPFKTGPRSAVYPPSAGTKDTGFDRLGGTR